MGILLVDPMGNISAACSSPLSFHYCSTEFVEAYALLLAIRMATLHGFGRVCFKGDCLSLISKVLAAVEDLSPLGHMVDLLCSLLSSFEASFVSFIPRRLNKSAHCLARHGFSVSSFLD